MLNSARRHLAVSLSALLVLGAASWSQSASALELRPYTAEAVAASKAAGGPVVLHFHAPWCGTCVTQEKALQELKGDEQLKNTVVYVVDYDTNKPLRRELKVRSQSVFVVYKGDAEVARGVETSPAKIRMMLAKAN